VREDDRNDPAADTGIPDRLARFRSWRGFLVAAIVVNALFVYTLLGHRGPEVVLWHKTLIWLPFTAIATAVYLAIMSRLGMRGPSDRLTLAGRFYVGVCVLLIVANWAILLAA